MRIYVHVHDDFVKNAESFVDVYLEETLNYCKSKNIVNHAVVCMNKLKYNAVLYSKDNLP